MYRNLFVPLDGSEFSARAIPVALEIAQRSGATIHLASVIDPSAHIPFATSEIALPKFDDALATEARQRQHSHINAHAEALGAQGATAVGHVLEGTVVEALAEGAVSVNADLVVMTTHGRSGFSRLRMGSVASAFLTRASAPVLLVHGHDGAVTAPRGTLLCTVDGSAFGERIVSHAARLARVLELPMRLMAVARPHTVAMAPFGVEMLASPDALSQEEARLRAHLTGLLPQCPPDTTITVIADLTIVSTVLEEAERAAAGAIALSTHGRTGIARMMLGSVADELIRRATLPLLVFHPVDDAK